MNSLHRRKQFHRRKRTLSILILILIVVIAYAVYMSTSSYATGVAHGILRPVVVVTGWANEALDGVSSYLASSARLKRENEELRHKLFLAHTRLLQSEVISNENEIYRSMWQRDSSTEGVLASVMTRPPQSPYDRLVLDVGERHDVKAGDRVVRAGAALGIIETVFEQTAIARLYSTDGETVQGYLSGADVTIELRGSGSGAFRVSAPSDVTINQGDIVFTRNEQGLVLAEVVAVDSRPNNPEQYVLLQSPINVTSVQSVRVVKAGYDPFANE